MLVNNGHFDSGTTFSDGGRGTPDDPSNDIGFLDQWINQGGDPGTSYRGLWMSGDNVATDFTDAAVVDPSTPKLGFLNRELATDLVSSSYRELMGYDPQLDEACRMMKTTHGKVFNDYSMVDHHYVMGVTCPQRYDYDVLEERDGESGIEFVSLMWERTDLSDAPGYYASVDHIFTPAAGGDSVRCKIDGFSLHGLRWGPTCDANTDLANGIVLWMRDVLGGTGNNGYFYDKALDVQYCPPVGSETVGVPGTGRKYANALFQNYPNPFRGVSGTTIHYSVAKEGKVEIRIFDVAGRLVNTIVHQAKLGDNFVIWDGKGSNGRSVASGVYFYQIQTDLFKAHKKMLLVN
jgi:hypothetical protein